MIPIVSHSGSRNRSLRIPSPKAIKPRYSTITSSVKANFVEQPNIAKRLGNGFRRIVYRFNLIHIAKIRVYHIDRQSSEMIVKLDMDVSLITSPEVYVFNDGVIIGVARTSPSPQPRWIGGIDGIVVDVGVAVEALGLFCFAGVRIASTKASACTTVPPRAQIHLAGRGILEFTGVPKAWQRRPAAHLPGGV